MNQTTPRCLQCGENPRILIGRSEFATDYHPLCQECHLKLRDKSLREAGLPQEGSIRRPMNLPELVAVKTRFITLGLAAASIFQLPLMVMNGILRGVIIHSILIAVTVPWTVAGFWLRRKA